MGKGGSQTIGYHYLFSILFGLGRGPIDELRAIKVGDRIAWDGHLCIGGPGSINKPALFGGEKKEGGIQGPFYLNSGAADQVLPPATTIGVTGDGSGGTFAAIFGWFSGPYGGSRRLPSVKDSIASATGDSLISEFRGAATLWFDGLISSMNPYPKEWKFRLRRYSAGWQGGTAWYKNKSLIFMSPDVLDLGKKGDAIHLVLGATSGTVTWGAKGTAGDSLTVSGVPITFTDDPAAATVEGYVVKIGANASETAQRVKLVLQANGPALDVTVDGAGAELTISLASGAGKIHAMNPAHIIYQCLTDSSWGRGLDAAALDENSFIHAANALCAENFGLCLKWMQKEDIDQFIKIVVDHIGAALYQDPETGLETLRLIRDDYVLDDLPLFTPGSGLVEINEDDSASPDNNPNEVIGTGHDPITDEDFQVRVHNLAARYSNGAPNPDDKKYPGIPTRHLLARVLQRDLKQYASGLKKFVVTLDRSGYRIRPGMVFRIQDARRGLGEIVLRAGEIEDVASKSGKITIKAIQDVFSLPATSYVTVPEATWTPPPTEAVPPAAQKLVEMSYRDILVRGTTIAADKINSTDAYVGQLALAPNTTSYEYDFATRVTGESQFTFNGTGPFTGSATLAAAITPLQTTFVLANLSSFSASNAGEAILIEDELMQLVDFDDATGVATVLRGTADTIPAAHALGARAWTIDDDLVPDPRTYQDGETVEAIVLSRTASDVLTPDEGDIESIVVNGRAARPYPPGAVQIDGVSIYAPPASVVEPAFTWAHRDRVQQEDTLVGHEEGSTGPEAGVTYNLRLFNPDDLVTPLREVTGLAGDNWTYDAAMQAVDAPPSRLYVELEAERDGLKSWQKYGFFAYLNAGYGMGYGMDYGGT